MDIAQDPVAEQRLRRGLDRSSKRIVERRPDLLRQLLCRRPDPGPHLMNLQQQCLACGTE
ncbi:MAG TPA: hypothetical protein VIG90_10860 [Pedomonas sp.]|uniref:hypothetical protein n=1 Tax=Pedomonas sp. TaxID=2976421 RepID=UPI002F42BA3B